MSDSTIIRPDFKAAKKPEPQNPAAPAGRATVITGEEFAAAKKAAGRGRVTCSSPPILFGPSDFSFAAFPVISAPPVTPARPFHVVSRDGSLTTAQVRAMLAEGSFFALLVSNRCEIPPLTNLWEPGHPSEMVVDITLFWPDKNGGGVKSHFEHSFPEREKQKLLLRHEASLLCKEGANGYVVLNTPGLAAFERVGPGITRVFSYGAEGGAAPALYCDLPVEAYGLAGLMSVQNFALVPGETSTRFNILAHPIASRPSHTGARGREQASRLEG